MVINMPKVSVIIPVYKVENLIERCARSLFEQTLDDIEYLFIDDCTPDQSVQILKKTILDYPNRAKLAKIIKMEKNSGQAAVRTKGMYMATGDYIIHCDSDDWVEKNMYEQMYNKAISEHCDCVICGFSVSNGIESKRVCLERIHSNLFDDLISHKVSSSLWNKMYKNKVFDKDSFLPPLGNLGEDTVINFQLAFKCKKVGVINEPLYYYFENEESICRKLQKESVIYRFSQSIKNIPVLLDFFHSINKYNDYKAKIIGMIAGKRVWLVPYLNDDECYNLWRNSFPEINKDLLLNWEVPVKEKIRFLLNYIRIRV